MRVEDGQTSCEEVSGKVVRVFRSIEDAVEPNVMRQEFFQSLPGALLIMGRREGWWREYVSCCQRKVRPKLGVGGRAGEHWRDMALVKPGRKWLKREYEGRKVRIGMECVSRRKEFPFDLIRPGLCCSFFFSSSPPTPRPGSKFFFFCTYFPPNWNAEERGGGK